MSMANLPSQPCLVFQKKREKKIIIETNRQKQFRKRKALEKK